jgi:hypothetical protein
MKNIILVGMILGSNILMADEINLKIDHAVFGKDLLEVVEVSSLKCLSMTLRGDTRFVNPDRTDEDPGTIIVECDKIYFEEGVTLTTNSHLQIRAKKLTGHINIYGDRLNIHGEDGVGQTFYKHGEDGAAGGAGGNGVDARLLRSATNGQVGGSGNNGTLGTSGASGSIGKNGSKNVLIDLRADGFDRDTIITIETRGGKGGNGGNGASGGNGGNGGNSGNGGKGGDANPIFGQSAGNGGRGGNAGNGGPGGNGGNAGNGGVGGDGGDIYILINAPGGVRPSVDFIPRRSPHMDNIGGNGGTAGVQGPGGKGGRSGAVGSGGTRGKGSFWNGHGDQGPFGRAGKVGADGDPGKPGLPGANGIRGHFAENITGFYDNVNIKNFDDKKMFEGLEWQAFNKEQLLELN